MKKNQILKTSTNFLQLRINAVSKIYEYYEKTEHNKKTKKLKQNCWIKIIKNIDLTMVKMEFILKKLKSISRYKKSHLHLLKKEAV